MQGYCFELITGPMSCGKTEELLRRIKRSIIAKKKVKVISPQIDTREQGDYIKSRNGLWLDAVKVKHSIQILSVVKDDDDVVAIDELQFFDSNIVKVIETLIQQGKKVIGTGLDLDFKGDTFGSMPQLMCIATTVDKFVLRYIANRKKPKQIDKMILLIIGFQKIDCSIRVKTSVLISIRLIKNDDKKSFKKVKKAKMATTIINL